MSKQPRPYQRKKKGRNDGYLSLDPLEIFDLYWNKKLSIRQIGFALNVSHTTVMNRMREYGIPSMLEGNFGIAAKTEYRKRMNITDEKLKEKAS